MKGEFYKMEYDAWDEGTFDLSLEEEAAYLRLCHQMYRRRAPIPNSTRMLCSLFRCHHVKAIALVKKLIAVGKIGLSDEGFLTNNRVATEVQDREKVRASRAQAGHKGGTRSGEARAKSLENMNQREAFASSVTKQNEPEKRREESNTPIVPTGTDEPLKGEGRPKHLDKFEACRVAYPKRNTSFPTTLARKRWLEAMARGDDPDLIIAGVKAYAAEQARLGNVGGPYVKSADAWLHQQRWRDYVKSKGSPEAKNGESVSPYAHWDDDRWREVVRIWKGTVGHWPWRASPPPDRDGTLVPQHILTEMGVKPWKQVLAERQSAVLQFPFTQRESAA